MERTIEQFHANSYNKFFSLFNSYNQKLIGILQSLLDSPPKSILDLACGVGHSTTALNFTFPEAEITGVDIDQSLINLAKKEVSSPKAQFKCCEISELLASQPNNSFDLIFVKSAYHYFEDQITIPLLQKSLKENGVIVIAERTARSAKSYPLPEIASSYWQNIFREPRPSNRFDIADRSEMKLSVSCYGEPIKISTQAYLDTVKQNQLVGLWMLKPEVIMKWMEEFFVQSSDDLYLFEEFWLYIYQNR